MIDFNQLHRVLEVAKITTPEYDDDYAEIQTILDLYKKMMKTPKEMPVPGGIKTECVLCHENGYTIVANSLVCIKHYNEYTEEAKKKLPDEKRVVYQRIIKAGGK